MTLYAEKVTGAGAEIFLAMAEKFHIEDGHPLTPSGKASIRDVAAGVDLAPAFFLVENNEKIGFFVLSLGYSPEHGGTDGFIDDIYIAPQHRGRGLGRQALDRRIPHLRHPCAFAGSRSQPRPRLPSIHIDRLHRHQTPPATNVVGRRRMKSEHFCS
jgi:GNAT superfamily N-acetyltransferase